MYGKQTFPYDCLGFKVIAVVGSCLKIGYYKSQTSGKLCAIQ